MALNKKILVIGSSYMELAMNVYKMPDAGESVNDDGGVAYIPGGVGAGAALAFKKLGRESVFMTKLGADLHGQKLYGYYKEMGINTSYIKVDHGKPTGFSLLIRENERDDRIIRYPGANNYISTENIIDAFASEPDALYLGLDISFDAVRTAAKIASSKGIPIFIDANPARKTDDLESLPEIEIFSPNEAETYEYTGIMPVGADASLRAALALKKRVNAKYIVIKQGARGAFVYSGKYYNMIPPYRPEKVVDTSGAGDAFGAAMVSEYLRSEPDIVRAAAAGCAAGAVAVSREGAIGSYPTEEELYAFLRERG